MRSLFQIDIRPKINRAPTINRRASDIAVILTLRSGSSMCKEAAIFSSQECECGFGKLRDQLFGHCLNIFVTAFSTIC